MEHNGVLDFRPEREGRFPHVQWKIYNITVIIGTVRSLWTWLWGRYYIAKNVFLVYTSKGEHYCFTYQVRQKTVQFYFCNIFIKPLSILIIFGTRILR